MNTFDLLNQFAEEYGVSNEKVPEFINNINNVNTLYELLNLPKDMLTYYNDKSELKNGILKEYIEKYSPVRYETKTLESIVEDLLDDIYAIMKKYNPTLEVYNDREFEKEIIKFDENILHDEDKVEFKRLLEIRQAIIDNKFGSIKWDW